MTANLHSWCRATIGSTRDALRAGTNPANAAAVHISTAATPKTTKALSVAACRISRYASIAHILLDSHMEIATAARGCNYKFIFRSAQVSAAPRSDEGIVSEPR